MRLRAIRNEKREMLTYLVERTVPPTVRPDDPENLALHARWAVDAYREVGAVWLGGVVTDPGMFSLVTVEREADLRRCAGLLAIPDDDVVLRRVIRPLGPFRAKPQ